MDQKTHPKPKINPFPHGVDILQPESRVSSSIPTSIWLKSYIEVIRLPKDLRGITVCISQMGGDAYVSG